MSIELTNETEFGVDLDLIHSLVGHVLEAMGLHPQAEVAVRLVDEAAMAELHVQWMNLPGPTDVMSFPMDLLEPGEEVEGVLGDIVLCPSVAAAQAADAGHTMHDELCLLTVHGLLHLMGFDHAEPEEKEEMFAHQRKLLLTWFARVEPGRTTVPEPTEA